MRLDVDDADDASEEPFMENHKQGRVKNEEEEEEENTFFLSVSYFNKGLQSPLRIFLS